MGEEPNRQETNELAKRIRNLIKTRGLSQSEFARKIGLSQQQVSNLLTGKRAWTQKTWEATAAALGVLPAELFVESGLNGDSVPVLLVFAKHDYQRIAEEARNQMVDISSFIKFAVAELVRRNNSKN